MTLNDAVWVIAALLLAGCGVVWLVRRETARERAQRRQALLDRLERCGKVTRW